MEFAVNRRLIVEAVAATAATAALLYFGNGLEPLWPLVWLTWVPVLWLALRSPWWVGAGASALATLASSLNLWSYFTRTLGMPASAWFAIFCGAAVLFALGVLLFRTLVLGGSLWSGLIALPAWWVTVEYIRSLATPHGTAGSLAYSQLGFLPFLQLASVTGPWGMTFMLLLFSSAAAIALHLRRQAPKRALEVAGAAVIVVAIVLFFGTARLLMPQGATVRVGLIASDAKGNATVVGPGAESERLFSEYARAAETLTSKGAQVIVIPEKVGVTLEGRSAGTDGILQELATRTGATIVAGVVNVDSPVKYNEARVYVPAHASVQRYHKEHMLPPFESDLKPGTELVLLPRSQQLWGVAICKDMDFANPARRYGRAGAGLMLVPAWDFVVDAGWHGHIAAMRGVENGFSIARAAKKGYLTVSDDRGRIIGEARSDSAPFATLVVDVPAVHHWTLYQVMGDWFAWVSIALTVFAFVRAASPRPARPPA